MFLMVGGMELSYMLLIVFLLFVSALFALLVSFWSCGTTTELIDTRGVCTVEVCCGPYPMPCFTRILSCRGEVNGL